MPDFASIEEGTEIKKGIIRFATDGENTANIAVQGNDSRNSNSRTPTSHAHSGTDITSGLVVAARLPDATESAEGIVELSADDGSESAGVKVVQDNDPRLTDDRDPTAHNHPFSEITSNIAIGQITDDTITSAKIVSLAYSKLTSIPPLAFLGTTNVFSAQQLYIPDQQDPIVLRRPSNTVGNAVGLLMQLRNSINANTTFGQLFARIITNTDGVETSALDFWVRNNGTLSRYLELQGSQLKLGPSTGARLIQDASGISTSDKTITWGNFSGVPIIDTATQTISDKTLTSPTINNPTVTGLDASTSAKGLVKFATDGENAASVAVQGNDARMSNARTPTAHNQDANTITTGTLPVGRGGTGKTSITSNALLKGNGTSAPTEITVGTTNQVIAVVSGTPTWKSLDSERTGKATASGTGSATVFNIAHGLGATPSYAFVDCSSHAINRTWTVDGTNIVVTFASAPASGTNNVIIYWRVIA